MNTLEVAYGLPGSGKTTLLKNRYNNLLLNGIDVVMLDFDTPCARRGIVKYLNTFEFEHSHIIIDTLIEPLKFMNILNDRNMNEFKLLINRFEPNVDQCIKNDIARARELNAIATIKHMKIIKLFENELTLQYKNISQITIIEHITEGR